MSDQSLPPENRTPEQIEMNWYKTVYQGDSMPQLTWRAIIMGGLLGGFMSLSNLYIGLKTGWGLGVAITACILSFAIWKTLHAVFPKWFHAEMSILENNCMQSTASAAGYSTGGTMVSAIAAYLIVTGQHIPVTILVLWTVFLAALGVFIAIPMKRQMINIEQLKFPSGIAAAETLRSLHSKGSEAMVKARALGWAGLGGGLIAWFRDAGKPFAIPASIPFVGSINGIPLEKLTFSFEMSAIMIAAGAIIGWKIAWSMLLGSVINYAWLAPWMAQIGAIDISKIGYREIVRWSTWTGASIMVTSALFAFASQWRTMGRALGAVTKIFGKKGPAEASPLDRIEVPTSWFLSGFFISALGSIALLYWCFGMKLWLGPIVILLAFVLSLVACRATGESDITPVGAMGQITQLTFGILSPASISTSLMTASVTANAAGSAADLLTDLKSGYLLGANPRKQFLAQFAGIFFGTIIVVPAFYLLVPTAADLGTARWPAPSAQVWAAVARLLSNGLESLHPTARLGILVGSSIGLLIPILERLLPKISRFIPSATGLGLAMVIPFPSSMAMFLGAFVALMLEKFKPEVAERFIIPVSSGIIAGESIIGVLVALLAASGVL